MSEAAVELPTRPVIMVVEDKEDPLHYRIRSFTDIDCTALGFHHSDDAIEAIFNVPSIDLILTDIDLDGTGKDQSGLAFARYISDLKLDVPIYGYSACFDDDVFSHEELQVFDGYLSRSMTPDEINASFEDLKEVAISHRRKKLSHIDEKISELKETHIVSPPEFAAVRQLVLNIDPTLEYIDEALIQSGYQLRVLSQNSLGNSSLPMLIWLREATPCEVEVYGFHELYAFGDTQEVAIAQLVELIQLVRAQMLSEEESTFGGDALRLRQYLSNMFG